MNLPIEVCAVIFKYLRLIDLVEVSCVFKTFYHLCKKNKYYVKKLRESKNIFKDRSWLIETYKKLFQRFYFAVFREIVVDFPFSRSKVFRKAVYSQMYYSLLPFLAWNHVFFCCRSQHESNVCLFCAKFCLNNRKVNLSITKILKNHYFENFLTLSYCDVLFSDEINLFVHSSSKDRKKSHCPNDFCEVISSPITLEILP